jgi:hypothetical protein
MRGVSTEKGALSSPPVCQHYVARYACFLEGYLLAAKEATDSDAAAIQMLMRKIGESKDSSERHRTRRALLRASWRNEGADEAMTAVSAARRIDRGRSHSYVLDGRPVLGVTTILSKALPKPALTAWAAREVAEFVASRREILTQLSDDELIDLCKGAPFRERDKAANRGTEVHQLAESLARGESVTAPEELAGHVESYLGFLEQFKPSDALIERPVFNRTYRYGGTFDMLCSVAGLGEHCMLDIKTNRSGPFGEVALQMAGYGRAEFYVDDNGEEQPMPPIDFYGVIWVRGDGYDLVPYDVTEREWKTFLYCIQVAWWTEHRMSIVRGPAVWQRAEEAS